MSTYFVARIHAKDGRHASLADPDVAEFLAKLRDSTKKGWQVSCIEKCKPTANFKPKILSTWSSVEDFETWLSSELDLKASMANESDKPVNPKNAAGALKPSIAAVPPIGFFAMGAAMQDGANKYGRFNWRDTEVTVSTFVDAMFRHLMSYYGGEDHALDSKVHHLGHLQAGAAIVLDGTLHNVLIDDRPKHKQEADLMLKMWEIIKAK